MKKIFLLAIFVAALFGCVQQKDTNQNFLQAIIEAKTEIPAETKNTACFSSGKCIGLEIARTKEERAKGLMFRQELDESKGMLFVFGTEEKHSFWMKNTLIPLDIIWVDSNGRIVHIEKAAPCTREPCKIYAPKSNALWVLETNQALPKKTTCKLDRKCF